MSIDWLDILGPLVDAQCGFDRSEISDLNQAVRRFSPRAIRLRPGIPHQELPFGTEAVGWFERARTIPDAGVRPGAYLRFAAGDYYIQDAGSLLPIALAAIEPGDWVCDVCAAPGGKSTAMAELLDGQGILVANEVIRSRLGVLELALARVGYGNHLITNLEVEDLAGLCGDRFDRVLVDAPCTGQSMVAKGKQTLAAFSPRQIQHSAARQRRIVAAAAKLVKPGGRLVYSTCTFSYAENEAVVQWLGQQLHHWRPVVLEHLVAWAGQLPGTHRLWPHRHSSAGGFAAAFDRPADCVLQADNDGSRRETASSRSTHDRSGCQTVRFEDLDGVYFVTENLGGQWIARDDGSLHRFVQGMPRSWMDVAFAGVEIARRSSNVWSPSYPSATLNEAVMTPARSIELDSDQAPRFMAGESLRGFDEADGWVVVRWHSRPLAWGKFSGGALKNHLLKQLRQTGTMLV